MTKNSLVLVFVFFIAWDHGFIIHFICNPDEDYVIMSYLLLRNECHVIKEVMRYTQRSKPFVDLKDQENCTKVNHLYLLISYDSRERGMVTPRFPRGTLLTVKCVTWPERVLTIEVIIVKTATVSVTTRTVSLPQHEVWHATVSVVSLGHVASVEVHVRRRVLDPSPQVALHVDHISHSPKAKEAVTLQLY